MIDLIQQLAIVEESARNEFAAVLMVVSLIGLAIIVAVAAVCCIVRVLTPVIEWVRRHRCDALLVAPFVVCLVYVGATKSTVGRVTYPYTDVETRYLIDAGSYVSNDFVHVAFTRSAVVPDTADLLGYVRPVGSTNDAEWVEFLDTTFGAFSSPSNIPYAGAISNDFQFFTTYTPGPVVHTNGVAVVLWQQGSEDRYLVPIRTGVYTNGFRIAPNAGITNSWPITVNLTSGVNDEE